jgi:hypothetical protein
MKNMIIATLITAASAVSLAQTTTTTPPAGQHAGGGHQHMIPPECQPIYNACTGAGFIQGAYKKGDGLWRDCIDPIMKGVASVPGATKSLPSVSPSVVQTCKTAHPKWGEGQVGGAAPTTQGN